MAYNTKYTTSFIDTAGNAYSVNLKKLNYTGSSINIDKYSKSPLIQNYRGGREAEDATIFGSDVAFTFYSEESDNNRYDEIFESNYKDWQLEVKKRGLIRSHTFTSSQPATGLTEISGHTRWCLDDSFNVPYNLSTSVTGNSIILQWTNPAYTIGVKSYVVHLFTASLTDEYRIYPSTGMTKIVFHNIVTEYENGTYYFSIAVSDQISGNNNRQFSNTVFQYIQDQDMVQNLSGHTAGNQVILTWTNPVGGYSFPVQSFSISRLRYLGGSSWGDSHVFYLNNNGSATSWTDTILTGDAIFRYQVAVCEDPNGFSPHAYTYPPFEIEFESVNLPPNIKMLSTLVSTGKYFGGWGITSQVEVSGGTGPFSLLYHYNYTGSANFNKTIGVTANTTIFNKSLEKVLIPRGKTANIILDPSSGVYSLGTTTKTVVVDAVSGSGKVSGVGLSGGGAGSTVTVSWGVYSDSGADTGYGYVIGRYLTSDFAGTNTSFKVAGMSSTSYVDNITALAAGNYTYYVQAISIANPEAEPNPSYYISPTYPDMVNINIT